MKEACWSDLNKRLFGKFAKLAIEKPTSGLNEQVSKIYSQHVPEVDLIKGEGKVGGGIELIWGDGRGVDYQFKLQGEAKDGNGNSVRVEVHHDKQGKGGASIHGEKSTSTTPKKHYK